MFTHSRIADVVGRTVTSGVSKRVLLRSTQSSTGDLEVCHYILTKGKVKFGANNTEYQHYVISGCGILNGKFLHGETTVFFPSNSKFGELRRHEIIHTGEGELRIITAAYRSNRSNFRWAKVRIRNLYEVSVGAGAINNQQLMTEEEHATMGALRMHALDVQTHAPLTNNVEHRNPEEVMYVLRGHGRAVNGGRSFLVGPGSLVYSREGEVHGMYNLSKTLSLQYLVLEFIEHDEMWSARGSLH